MARFSPFDGNRKPRLVELKVVQDEDSGEADSIPLQHLDVPLAHKAVDIASDLVSRYVGDAEQGTYPDEEFPYVGGLPVEVSKSLCRAVANAFVMQAPRQDGSAIYSCQELIALSVSRPAFWDNFQTAMREVNKKGDARKNAPGASPEDGGSTTPSDSDSSIPN